MKIKGVATLFVMAKDTRAIAKKDGSGTYDQTCIVYRQENEIGVLPVSKEILPDIAEGIDNTFEIQYFEGIINDKGLKSFKLTGVVPFKAQEKK